MQKGQLDTSFLATHRIPLEDGVRGYEMFRNKTDDCLRVVFFP
jgi:threonine dehydrogenase-like Zn-dependent dehydrogenase